jgi:hypothetical protein
MRNDHMNAQAKAIAVPMVPNTKAQNGVAIINHRAPNARANKEPIII